MKEKHMVEQLEECNAKRGKINSLVHLAVAIVLDRLSHARNDAATPEPIQKNAEDFEPLRLCFEKLLPVIIGMKLDYQRGIQTESTDTNANYQPMFVKTWALHYGWMRSCIH